VRNYKERHERDLVLFFFLSNKKEQFRIAALDPSNIRDKARGEDAPQKNKAQTDVTCHVGCMAWALRPLLRASRGCPPPVSRGGLVESRRRHVLPWFYRTREISWSGLILSCLFFHLLYLSSLVILAEENMIEKSIFSFEESVRIIRRGSNLERIEDNNEPQ
jgi:hypothetical protein